VRITCRSLKDIGHLREAVRLQQRVWGFAGDHAIPWSQMHVIARNGGVVLGAFSGEDLVGFLYSNPGWDGRRSYLYSKMLGVLPAYAGRGIGRMLKRRQRREALRLGYDRIVWTFDPLERGSALLNVGYLGVVSRHYLVNFYGSGGLGRLHAGLGTDRLLAEWWIRSPHAAARARRRAIPASRGERRAVTLVRHATDRDAPEVTRSPVSLPALVAMPSDIQWLKRRDLPLAEAWQRAIRRALRRAIAAGGVVADVVRRREASGLLDYYLITAEERSPARTEEGRSS
jgi:predicted GNAT superfamily acetyltransferase